MGYSFSDDIGDGVKVTFPFAFVGPDNGFFDPTDIVVEVGGVSVDFTLTGPTQVTLVDPPALGAVVRVRRVEDDETPYTDFQRGNAFSKENLNRSFQQQLYLTHMLMDGFLPDGHYFKQPVDFGGFQLKGIAAGTEVGDAVTFEQLSATSGLITQRYRETVPVGGKTVFKTNFDIFAAVQNFLLLADGVPQYDSFACDEFGIAVTTGTTQYINAGSLLPSGVDVLILSSVPSSLGGVSETVFDTAADMVAASLLEGAIYSTKGRFSPGGGGAATYLIVNGNFGDGYGLLNTGAFTAVPISPFIDSKVFGAVVDGVTDDKPALQALINWSIANGRGYALLSKGAHRIGSQLLVKPTNIGDVITFNLIGPGIEECSIVSDFTGSVVGQDTAGFAILVDGIRNSKWSGFTVDYSVLSDVTTAGRGGICGVCRSQSLYNNSFDGLGFVGGSLLTDRETNTRRSAKILGNQAVSSSTGYVSYFNKFYRSRFNFAYTHVECVEGDGDPGTSQPNATFVGQGNLFERYIIAVNFTNTDECSVDGFDTFFQQAAGVVGINGGETYCVYSDGEFITLKFACEPGANSRPFALGANADRVIAEVVANTALVELVDPANTGKLRINTIANELEGLASLNRRRANDINIFGNGTSAHSGSTSYFVNLFRKSGSANKMSIGFDNTSNFARVAVDGQNLDLRPVQDTNHVIVADSVWNQSLMRLGNYYFWVDGSARLRIKNGLPTSDTDGTIVGTQV